MRQKQCLKKLIASQDNQSTPPKLHVLFPKKEEKSLELKVMELEKEVQELKQRERTYIALLKDFNLRLSTLENK
jgi:hypothetical protein